MTLVTTSVTSLVLCSVPLIHLILQQSFKAGVIVLILQLKKLEFRDNSETWHYVVRMWTQELTFYSESPLPPWSRSGEGWILGEQGGLLSTSPGNTNLSRGNLIKTISTYRGRRRPPSQILYQFSRYTKLHIIYLNWEIHDIYKCQRKESKMTRKLFLGKKKETFPI